jgi:hypothetical protein
MYAAVANGNEASLLGGVIHSRGETFAKLLYLAPASRLDHAALPGLVEHLVTQVGEWGAFHVIAEINETSDAFSALRQTGFSVYAWQRIWDVSELSTSTEARELDAGPLGEQAGVAKLVSPNRPPADAPGGAALKKCPWFDLRRRD